ncbi:MAG: hypothetical protein AAF404_05820 [Pseudomonadota bacterium]
MHVLFVTENRFDRLPYGDGSTRYRCFNVAEALLAAGHRATVASLSELSLETLGRYDIISVLRPRAGRRLDQLLQHARQCGIYLVADFDDLIFDVSAAAQSPLVLNGFADEDTVSRGFARFARAARCFDEITVSTEPLAVAARRCFGAAGVHVVSNGLSPMWLQHADNHQCNEAAPGDGATLSYLPGTRSHDADFRSVQSAVSQWLASDAARRLKIVGELTLDHSVVNPRQVIQEPLVPYFQLPDKIRGSGITLAPLVSNQFNQAKSHIKFLESAAFGVPIVASPNADISQHRQVRGLVCAADSTRDWLDAIEQASQVSRDETSCRKLSHYVRSEWVSTATSTSTIERWCQRAVTRPASTAPLRTVSHPQTFYLSLRPVPHFYTRNGWRAHEVSHLIVFDHTAALPDQSTEQAIERQVAASGANNDQWVVLICEQADAAHVQFWQQKLMQWRPAAAHIEVTYARTAADRCSIVFQCDHVIDRSPADFQPRCESSQRTRTPAEKLHVSMDRWQRKARKLRESPRRFFSDSVIVKSASR